MSGPTIRYREAVGFDGLVMPFTIQATFSLATFTVAGSATLSSAHAHRRERVDQPAGGDPDGYWSTKSRMPRIPGTVSIRLQSHGEILRRTGRRGCCSCQLIEPL